MCCRRLEWAAFQKGIPLRGGESSDSRLLEKGRNVNRTQRAFPPRPWSPAKGRGVIAAGSGVIGKAFFSGRRGPLHSPEGFRVDLRRATIRLVTPRN